MVIFGDFFASCISASRVQHISDLRLKFALSPYHMADIQSATAEIRRGRKERRRRKKKKPQGKNIMVCPIP